MNIQNMVNNREGLLCAQSEDHGILIQHRTEPRINLREFGIHPFQTERLNVTQLGEGEMCSLLTFQKEAVKEKATIEVRTKERIKNNRLMRFVQYKKQTVIAMQSLCPLNDLIYRDNYPFVQYGKQPANHILHFGSIKLGKPKNNPDSDLQYLTSPIWGSAKNNQVNNIYSAKLLAQCYSEHQGNFSPMMRLPDNIQLVGLAQSGEYCSKRSQPLGVMPRDFNSFLIIRLIQAETEASPSSANAVFIPCSNDGSTLKAICLFPFPDIVMVDTWFTPIYTLFVHQVYGICNIKTTPANGIGRTTRGLTTNDRLCIEVAMYKYTFLIGKGKTRLSEINPIRLISVLAKSENEARLLAGNRHLVFVARQEVAHA